jgi:hypothetical protein
LKFPIQKGRKLFSEKLKKPGEGEKEKVMLLFSSRRRSSSTLMRELAQR